ncbi:MAG: hypothetical protein QXN79_03185 [Zestosphaera sp.]
MKEKKVDVLVPTLIIVALALASLITIAERGPPKLGLPIGASPLNAGKLGTTKMLSIIKERFNDVRLVRDWSTINETVRSCDKALIITVSPEKPFTDRELDSIDSLIRKCNTVLFLLADETGNSNALLEKAGLNLRIDGRIVLQAPDNVVNLTMWSLSNVSTSTNSFFVEALFSYPNGYIDRLYLDKASFIQIRPEETNVSILGVTTSYVAVAPLVSEEVKETRIDYYLGRVVIAASEERSKYRALIISDGSIFTNQVLSHGVWGLKYERLLRESLNFLTNDTSGVVVLVDSSKYENVDLTTNPALLEYADPLTLSLYAVFRLIHPATWFAPLINFLNDLTNRWLDSLGFPMLACLTLILGTLLAIQLVRSVPEVVKDQAVEEVKSKEFVVFSNLADEVISGKITLGKQDFIELYEIVDEIFRNSVGVPLNSGEVVSILVSRGVDPEKARDFWSSINRTYLKAKKKLAFPPVLMWGRKVRKSIIECEEILNVLGTSLLKDVGFEYLLAR